MRQAPSWAVWAAALAVSALATAARAVPHKGDGGMGMHGTGTAVPDTPPPAKAVESGSSRPLSYFAYGEHSGAIVAHIVLMVIAWCFLLPTAVMLSVARSRYTLPSQFIFLAVNAVGLLVGTIYNSQTPDLYENNAHHKIGWIATWVFGAHVFMALVFFYAGRGESKRVSYESAPFLPVPQDEMPDHLQTTMAPRATAYSSDAIHAQRWSRDSGQGTERNSSSLHSCPVSPTCESPRGEDGDFDKPEAALPRESATASRRRCLHSAAVDRFFTNRVAAVFSSRVLRALSLVYNVIDRLILPFGFIAVTTGAVTFGGIMRGHAIFNGLAHFIKGGIFFWYGLLTLGRWMGCWADLGWAWNVKPTRPIVGWKARVPSAEFTESAVIFAYGASNVFLEHLGGWGGAWSAQDLEHVSIAVMFFGGGLCGILFESKRIRDWLNKTVLFDKVSSVHGHQDAEWQIPNTQSVSLNPMPALVILLLGLMMGSHHQSDMTSTMVHKQWGNLLIGFGVARCLSYALLFLKPPTSYLPARLPTEILASFCLISGGLIFMLSTADVVATMIYFDLDAMFTFTVSMGFTAFIMAWEILVIAIKAWAVKKEMLPLHLRQQSFDFAAGA